MEPSSCPECCRVRKAQGFSVVVDETNPLCSSCQSYKDELAYYNSEAHQTWLQSIPKGTLEEMTEWIRNNPPPRKEFGQ